MMRKCKWKTYKFTAKFPLEVNKNDKQMYKVFLFSIYLGYLSIFKSLYVSLNLFSLTFPIAIYKYLSLYLSPEFSLPNLRTTSVMRCKDRDKVDKASDEGQRGINNAKEIKPMNAIAGTHSVFRISIVLLLFFMFSLSLLLL